MGFKDLEHAGGSAADVPRRIGALTSTDFDARDAAYHGLRRALVAPGRWFSASAPTIEALAKLVAPAAVELTHILTLIADIAAGDHRWLIADGKARSSAVRTAAQEAAIAVVPKVAALLKSKKTALRSVALFFLAVVGSPENDGLTAAIGKLAAADKAAEVRSSAALWLGLEARRGNAAAGKLLAKLKDDDSLVIGAQWLAAELAGKASPLPVAAKAAAGWVATPAESAALQWGDDTAWEFAIDDVLRDGPRRAALAPLLVEAALDRFGPQAERRANVADTALRLCGLMTDHTEDEVAELAKLTASQRATARALLGYPDVISGLGHGIPRDGATARRWLEIDPPSPLELPVKKGGPPRWLHLRNMIGKAKQQQILAAAVEGLEGGKRLQVMQALASGAYGIKSAAELKITAQDLAGEVAASKDGAVPWAKQALADAPPGIRTPELLTAMATLVRAGEPISPEWDDLVGCLPPDLAREVLAAIPPARRAALALRWAQTIRGGHATFLKNVAPVFDLVGSSALAKLLRPWLKLPTVKNTQGVVKLIEPLLGRAQSN